MPKWEMPEGILSRIQSEREYQNRKWGGKPHEVGAWLTIMRGELKEAEDAWRKADNDVGALCEILQVVAVGIACMEQHGCVDREDLQRFEAIWRSRLAKLQEQRNG